MEVRESLHHQNIIESVQKDSIAWDLGLEVGDLLLSINGKEIRDIIDYRFLIHDEDLDLMIQKKSGEMILFEIEKDYDEDLGIDFSNPLIDHARSCSNHCVFCFIDQLPQGLRKTLYFKDDDSRLSFLQGNFITLTNMKEEEIQRMIQYRISPVNVSIHTTNPDLRVAMLRHKRAGEINSYLKAFSDANLDFNGQIVLIPGMNDGKELEKTMEDLAAYQPALGSVAIVPVGLTKHRRGLEPLRTFTEEECARVIEQVEKKQRENLEKYSTRLFFLSDEFYLKAGLALPEEEAYEGYPQIENGVGMTRSFLLEVEKALENKRLSPEEGKKQRLLFATSTLSKDTMESIEKMLKKAYPFLEIEVVAIENNFFGQDITVSGLLTAQDLFQQLKGKKCDVIMLPRNMFRQDELITLDDKTLADLKNHFQKEIYLGPWDGFKFIQEIEKVMANG